MNVDVMEGTIGVAMGQMLGIDDFWAYFDSLADPEGNLSKENFGLIMTKVLNTLIANSGVVDKLIGGITKGSLMVAGQEFSTERQSKLRENILQRINGIYGVIIGALVRFFDSDGNGSVSKVEFVAACSLTDVSASNFPLIIHALFRVLDENGNGTIEATEIAHFLSDLISAAFNMYLLLLEEIEPIIEGAAKKMFLAGFSMITSGSNTLDIRSAVDNILWGLEKLAKGEDLSQDATPEDVERYTMATNVWGLLSAAVAGYAAEVQVPPEQGVNPMEFISRQMNSVNIESFKGN